MAELTPTWPLTVADVRALLVRAIAEKGEDYIYVDPEGRKAAVYGVTCVNFAHDGSPSCIAGHVYHYAGLTPDEAGRTLTVREVNTMLPNLFADWDVVRALIAAQVAQDAGWTWGKALAAFDHAAGR